MILRSERSLAATVTSRQGSSAARATPESIELSVIVFSSQRVCVYIYICFKDFLRRLDNDESAADGRATIRGLQYDIYRFVDASH